MGPVLRRLMSECSSTFAQSSNVLTIRGKIVQVYSTSLWMRLITIQVIECMFLTCILIITGLYYITGFPLGILLSNRVSWMYREVGVNHPYALHIGISLIPWVGFWILCLVLRIEAENYNLWREHQAIEQYRSNKEGDQ